MGKIRIALLSGGWSGEREISIRRGEAVYQALDKRKYHVARYDPREDLSKLIKNKERTDLAFVLLHGKFGEDGIMLGKDNRVDWSFNDGEARLGRIQSRHICVPFTGGSYERN